MVYYAPAWARKRRSLFLPASITVGVSSFLALALLPPFTQAVATSLAAATLGSIAWASVMLLANGEPLQEPGPRATELDPQRAVEFVVHFDPALAARVRREFWWRSVSELRMGTTVVSPIAMGFFTLLCYKLDGFSVATFVFMGFAALNILMLVTFPALAGRAGGEQARRFPEQRILVAPQGIAVGEGTRGLAWSSFVRRWESRETITLVMDPMTAIQLPRRDVPKEARQLIAEGVPRTS